MGSLRRVTCSCLPGTWILTSFRESSTGARDTIQIQIQKLAPLLILIWNRDKNVQLDLLKARICDIFYNKFHFVQLEYTTNEQTCTFILRDI